MIKLDRHSLKERALRKLMFISSMHFSSWVQSKRRYQCLPQSQHSNPRILPLWPNNQYKRIIYLEVKNNAFTFGGARLRASSLGLSGGGAGKLLSPNFSRSPAERPPFGTLKLSGSDRECIMLPLEWTHVSRRQSCVTYLSQFSKFHLFYLFYIVLYISIY